MTNKEAIIWLRGIRGQFTGNCTTDTLVPISRCDIQAIDLAIKALEEKPQGEWEKCQNNMFRCSNCRQADEVPTAMGAPIYNFCPNCGAEMREEGEEE